MKKTNEIESNPEYSEITPFINRPAQNFFTRWCDINDSIVPKFIPRRKWGKIGSKDILEKNSEEKRTLYLPKDLHLWEMVDVIRAIDNDTYANKPELANERADNLQLLGVTLEKAGIYLQEYSEDLVDVESEGEAKQLVQTMSKEFYNYGLSLQNKELSNVEVPKEEYLSQSDKDELDKWLLGSEVYQKRLDRLGDNPSEQQKEDLRIHLFHVYFNSLVKEGYKADGDETWETKTGPTKRFQDQSIKQVTKTIKTPESELKTSIFSRGVEKLVSQMKIVGWEKAVHELIDEGADFDIASEQVKLINQLEIPRLKAELEEIRKTGNVQQISYKEFYIAEKIHEAVTSYTYKNGVDNDRGPNYPSKMLETQFINCLGSSVLGGGLLKEAGINYLHVHVPEHSVTLLITSDKKVYWQDFTPPSGGCMDYIEITSDMIDGDVDLSDLSDLSKFPDEGLTIHINKMGKNNKGLTAGIYKPEIGLQSMILNNTGNYLNNNGKHKEALEAFRQATINNPNYSYPYNGLGNALSKLGRYEEAIDEYKKAISIDPEDNSSYLGLGQALSGLGRKDEAIKAYEAYLSLENDEYWIKIAKRSINKLRPFYKRFSRKNK